MTRDLFERASEVFLAACERNTDSRRAFLEDACADDPALKAEVESLLRFDGADIQRIGRYEIRQVIASGGMGTVYEAVQDHPHRLVALKVLRHGAVSATAMKRFRREAEILGRLRHANIAQIYDAGTFDDPHGVQPFFAMELVKGRPLVAYCDGKDLGTRERLEMLAKVCDAVQYAHHMGVIHRDLKPDNVLVDDFGEPKVLDFGIARATDSDIQTTTLRTDVGQLIGTVPYMSPEQVTGDPHAVDTRSDVYSLGVVLYELLCGRLPHDLRDKTIPEAVRLIREEDPTPLSSVNRVFRGEVDTIVAKALDKDPDRRYQAAADLAADLRHYLADEPIVARPASTLYQLRKFARRNRALVGGVLGMFVLLVAGITGTTAGLIRANTQAAQERETNDFLMMLFAAGDSDDLAAVSASNEILTLEQLVDRASAKIESAFSDRPVVRADMHFHLGRLYWRLERNDDMGLHLKRAHGLYEETLGANAPKTLVSLTWYAWYLERLRQYVKAEGLHEQAASGLELVCGADDRRTINASRAHAINLRWQARYPESEGVFKATLETARAALGETDRMTLRVVHDYAYLLHNRARHVEQEALVLPALEASRRDLPAGDLLRTRLAWAVGTAILRQGRAADAVPYFEEADDGYQRVGAGVVHEALVNRFGLVKALTEDGRADDARLLIENKIEDCLRELGKNHEYTMWAKYELGDLLREQRQLDEAVGVLRDAYEHYPRVLGDDHYYVLFATQSLARALRDRDEPGDRDEALQLYRHAYEIRNRTPADADALQIRYELGHLLLEMALFEDALEIIREQLEVQIRVHGEDGAVTLGAKSWLGKTLLRAGRPDEAEPWLLEAFEKQRKIGDDYQWAFVTQYWLGRMHLDREEYEQAEHHLLGAYKWFIGFKGPQHRQTRGSLPTIIDLYEAWAKPEKAAEYRALLRE